VKRVVPPTPAGLLALLILALAALSASPAIATAKLPAGWPQRFEIGVADQPDGAAGLKAKAPFGFRYQYLTGGVAAGTGWSTWNPNGTFVTRYIAESRAAGIVPVFTYYQMLGARPGASGGEADRDLANLRDPATMRAYWRDFTRFLRRAHGSGLVVAHIEPDLWGYLEQRHQSALARRFARRVVRLRNRYARNVALGWHLSIWGTGEDPTYSKPSLGHMDELAARSAAFWRAAGGASFDVTFLDVEDRDAGFNAQINHDDRSAWGPADFARDDAYLAGFHRRTRTPLVIWQIPLGNSTLDDTWTHFTDSRVEYWLGDRAHLTTLRDAGVVALLYGGGADGTTSPTTDGGLFFRLSAAYLAQPLAL
jgi:hypothetical protein